jgi:hypothetical protein
LLVEVGPEFVSDGSLAFTPLGPVIPAVPAAPGTIIQAFTPAITALGARHPVTAPFTGASLPSWYRQEMVTPNGGDVLMSGINNAPLLILSTAGQGRVGLLLSDQFWLWTRGGAYAGPALPLLRRCVHWLLDEPALEAEALSASISSGQLEVRRQTLAGSDPGDASVIAPDGRRTSLRLRQSAPGIYQGNMPADQPGVWQVAEGGFRTDTSQALENALEFQDLAATATILGPISNNVIWLGQNPRLSLAGMLQRRHASEVTGERDMPLLPPFPAMILLLALFGAAWWRERG